MDLQIMFVVLIWGFIAGFIGGYCGYRYESERKYALDKKMLDDMEKEAIKG
jgi:hypothetical protein